MITKSEIRVKCGVNTAYLNQNFSRDEKRDYEILDRIIYLSLCHANALQKCLLVYKTRLFDLLLLVFPCSINLFFPRFP